MASSSRAAALIVASAVAAALATGCGAPPPSQQSAGPAPAAPPAKGTPLQAIGAPEGEVAIVAWPGYIERGETARGTTGSPISKPRRAARSM